MNLTDQPTNQPMSKSLVGYITPFTEVVEDLSPHGYLLSICGEPYRALNTDDYIFVAITVAMHWKQYEVNFARINNLRHWLEMAEKYRMPSSQNSPFTLADTKDFINKIICFVYPVSADESINAKRNKNLEFVTELFSIRFNNYTIGGQ